MTHTKPVNHRGNCRAIYDEASFDMDEVPPGHFHFYTNQGSDDLAGMLFGCPCGCGDLKSVDFRGHVERRPSWEWDGNKDSPTLHPSINILQLDEHGNRCGEHWHGWLKNGEFISV